MILTEWGGTRSPPTTRPGRRVCASPSRRPPCRLLLHRLEAILVFRVFDIFGSHSRTCWSLWSPRSRCRTTASSSRFSSSLALTPAATGGATSSTECSRSVFRGARSGRLSFWRWGRCCLTQRGLHRRRPTPGPCRRFSSCGGTGNGSASSGSTSASCEPFCFGFFLALSLEPCLFLCGASLLFALSALVGLALLFFAFESFFFGFRGFLSFGLTSLFLEAFWVTTSTNGG